jgi:nucleoid DNA-binding protein
MAKTKTKKGKSKAAAPTDAPKIVGMKGGLPVGGLVSEILAMMEDDLRISKKSAKDFTESLVAVVEREISEGNPVNLFGLVKVTPRFHTKGQREVFKEFGNPESGKHMKKYPAKVSVKATPSKKIKDALPSAAKLGKRV